MNDKKYTPDERRTRVPRWRVIEGQHPCYSPTTFLLEHIDRIDNFELTENDGNFSLTFRITDKDGHQTIRGIEQDKEDVEVIDGRGSIDSFSMAQDFGYQIAQSVIWLDREYYMYRGEDN